MGRTAIAVASIGLNGSAAVTPTVIDQSNGMSLPYVKDNVMIVVYNSYASPITVTLQGVNGNDDIAVTVASGATKIIGNVESFRVKNAQAIDIDFSASATGTIYGIVDSI